jgi:lipopolysaccharide export system protein LptA
VWTPKRAVLLAASFVAFLAAYVVYAYFLGGIDGLPPLPVDYGPVAGIDSQPLPPRPNENSAEKLLRIAFGEDCHEKDWKIKIESQDKGFVLATQDVTVLPDGRVELAPFSFVIFRKDKEDGKFPEIDTIRSKKAFLSFDRPVTSITEIGSRKIVGGVLGGPVDDEIFIVNNRRTPERDDDISLYTRGPVYYEEARHQIWTMADVRLTDPESKSKPMTVTGTGMDIYLSPTAKAGAPKSNPGKSGPAGPSSVERIVLRSNVDMNLWVDSRSGFLGAGRNGASRVAPAPRAIQPQSSTKQATRTAPVESPPKAAAQQDQKAKVRVVTQGPFQYDLRTKKAVFDIAKQGGERPNVVTVDRFNEDKLDHLRCDHLELQFYQAKGKEAPVPNNEELEGLDIESVRATGMEVVLTSDAEILEAHGSDFFYDRRQQLTVLKGSPKMWALKEGNEIEAPELQFLDLKGGQQATAIGEGRIRLLDKKTGNRPLEARWKNKLVYGKDGAQDLLTLFGEAAFVDHEHSQELHADLLKVWLEPSDPNIPAGSDQPKRRPQRVDALGRVTASSPDMRVHDTEWLVLNFTDPRPSTIQLPDASANRESPAPHEATRKPPDATPAGEQQQPGAIPLLNNPLQVGPTDASKPKRPIYLSARQVTAHIVRGGERNDLEKLRCEGMVHVRQDPETPEDRGVEIRGSQFDLNHRVEGNIMTVIGDNAQVQLNKIFVLGPQIDVDQTTNEVWVTGLGAMRMPSKNSFDGAPLEREVQLTINWEKSMLFDGQLAKFRGGILAEQETGHLFCQEMDVWLDHKISLREGEKRGESPKVQKLLCERDVWIEDVVHKNMRVVSYKRMDCFQLSLDNDNDNQETIANASGPGRVRIFALGANIELSPGIAPTTAETSAKSKPAQVQPRRGASTPGAPSRAASAPGATNTSAGEVETKLTQVTYDGRMTANNRKGSAIFFDNVQAINVPTNDPELKINIDHPPEGYMYLRCDKLEVFSHKFPDGHTSKEMRATGKVTVEGKDFSGLADEVKYDESKEQVILEGTEGKPAVLYQGKVKGADRDALRGQKITYWRTTGTFTTENATGLIGHN